jgi:DNA-binding transcriptional MerR regulator
MNIGEASKASGLTPKTIRYYELIGLVESQRQDNGYRDYNTSQVQTLKFIHRVRSLGFTVQECRDLLAVYQNKNSTDDDRKEVARILQARLEDIDAKLIELEKLRNTLKGLTETGL